MRKTFVCSATGRMTFVDEDVRLAINVRKRLLKRSMLVMVTMYLIKNTLSRVVLGDETIYELDVVKIVTAYRMFYHGEDVARAVVDFVVGITEYIGGELNER